MNPTVHRELSRQMHADAVHRAEQARLARKAERTSPVVSFSWPVARLRLSALSELVRRRPHPVH